MKEMCTIFASNLIKKSIPLYCASISMTPIQIQQFHAIHNRKVVMAHHNPQTPLRVSGMPHDPTYLPGGSPPEVPRAPPSYNPGLPPEVPRRQAVPDFDPIPPEKPVPPPPPGPNPEFPGPPDPIPPKPEAPPPPGEPEVIPPRGPEITPPKPPEPSPPLPTQPDIPPPIMGSNGLAFY